MHIKKQSDLYTLPNIGEASVKQLEGIGISTIRMFLKIGPEEAYKKMCIKKKMHVHMAFLYVLRSAYSYARGKIDWSGALRWWMFRSPKDRELVVYYKNKFNKNHAPKKVIKKEK
jgi:hypothetical protein